VIVTEIDPITRSSGDGGTSATLEDVNRHDRHLRDRHGNAGIITVDDMAQMKHNAIVCNIGHFDNEIDMAGLARTGIEKLTIKPQVDCGPSRRPRHPRAGRRPPGEPRLRHRPPELS